MVIVGLWGTHAYEKHAQRSPSMPSITREPRGLISNHAPLRCCFASFQNNPLKRLHLKRALADTPLGSDRTNPISSQLLKLAFTLELCRLANNATPHQCPTTPHLPFSFCRYGYLNCYLGNLCVSQVGQAVGLGAVETPEDFVLAVPGCQNEVQHSVCGNFGSQQANHVGARPAPTCSRLLSAFCHC